MRVLHFKSKVLLFSPWIDAINFNDVSFIVIQLTLSINLRTFKFLPRTGVSVPRMKTVYILPDVRLHWLEMLLHCAGNNDKECRLCFLYDDDIVLPSMSGRTRRLLSTKSQAERGLYVPPPPLTSDLGWWPPSCPPVPSTGAFWVCASPRVLRKK